MRLVISGETCGAAAGEERAAALAAGWLSQRPSDDVTVCALGRTPGDVAAALGRDVVSVSDVPRLADLPRGAGRFLFLDDLELAPGETQWEDLRDHHGGWANVASWLHTFDTPLLLGSQRPLLGADSALASLASTHPHDSAELATRLSANIGTIAALRRSLPLATVSGIGRAVGSASGRGLAEIARGLGHPTCDALTHLLATLARKHTWDDAALHIHVGDTLETWDMPTSVVSTVAAHVADYAVPVVAVATRVGIGARERGTWLIDGSMELTGLANELEDAGSRLARTWAPPWR